MYSHVMCKIHVKGNFILILWVSEGVELAYKVKHNAVKNLPRKV